MATYIPGVTDYIPQAQPFQPDYNFLGNMLQNSQTKYDQNYQNLSKTYGTLLNSPMLREDNMKQRDEFFKMIDGDLKRISGMDLSLQQNVDSANKVFDSFYKNKSIVKDMTYTKAYQKQLAYGENLKNCLTCEGQYSDEAMNALHYRADEYKKASKDEAMTMDPGSFVPSVNVQEKVTKYAKELLASTGSAFGISTVVPSSDGKWNVTLTNGELLSTPLQQILLNQYGKDPEIIAMHEMHSYVNRKSYIAANAPKFGGDEVKAENEYFNAILPRYIDQTTKDHTEAQNLFDKVSARKALTEKKLKQQGSNGDDALSAAVIRDGYDYAAAKEALDYHEGRMKSMQTLNQNPDIRFKRNAVDKMLGHDLMTKAITDSAVNVAALTGQMKKEIDPYAKSTFELAQDIKKLNLTYDLQDRNNARSAAYDLEKQKQLKDYEKTSSLIDGNGTFVIGGAGTTDPNGGKDVHLQQQAAVTKSVTDAVDNANDFNIGFVNMALGILKSDNPGDEAKKTLTRTSLIDIYGAYSKGKPGFDSDENVFKDKDGKVVENPSDLVNQSNWKEIYTKTQAEAKSNSEASDEQKAYLNGAGKVHMDAFNTNKKLFDLNQKGFRENNKAVKNHGETQFTNEELSDWNSIFRPDNSLKLQNEFVREYAEKNANRGLDETGLIEKGTQVYKDMHTNYDKFFNAGQTVGGEPIVKGLNYNAAMGKGVGGVSAGGYTRYDFSSSAPGAPGTQGLMSFKKDAAKEDAIFAIGDHNTAADASASESSDAAKLVYDTMMGEIAAGSKDAITGEIAYYDLALSDKNKVAIRVKPSPAFLEKHGGTADKPNVFDDPRLAEGVFIAVDKNTATNMFTQNAKMKPDDIIHQHQNIDVDIPNGGKVTILKPNAQGITYTQGIFDVAIIENGKVTMESIPIPETHWGSDALGSQMKELFERKLAENKQHNEAVMNSVIKPVIKEVHKLPAVQKTVQQTTQQPDIDLTSIFTENMKNIR